MRRDALWAMRNRCSKELVVKSDYHQPIFVPAHSGKKLEFLAVTHKLTGQQTGGAYYLFESAFGPGAGNQLHVHAAKTK